MTLTPDLQSLDDEALAGQAGANPAAFAVLYERYLEPVYRYAYRRLENSHEAEDLAARAFMDALENLADRGFRPGACFGAWLFTIVRRRLVDRYRAKNPLALDEEFPALPLEPLAGLESRDDRRQLARLMARLDPEKQELLRLRFAAGLSFAAIAELEQRGLPGVKMSIYRALDWLRDHWEEADHGTKS
jgi:RNA polymerase sigma-70 factor (ECF subfamily)